MSVTACQGLGFVVSMIGFAGTIAATCMDQWSTQDLYNNPVTAVFNYQGLWRSCVRESSGFTECRGYYTLLGLPALGLATCSWDHPSPQTQNAQNLSECRTWVHAELETTGEKNQPTADLIPQSSYEYLESCHSTSQRGNSNGELYTNIE
ncbi:Hypothetical predicted protein [Marmota monax]|uniref:Claudin n=1 Tax=Marmota monax TaxID=9995 RepID=A0A5E4C3P9_MARMO|nr:hypothetical protein GHT09_009762 [Marmota monax]VTJ76504.1 Hypothetical predicted protein [Marmota monax]